MRITTASLTLSSSSYSSTPRPLPLPSFSSSFSFSNSLFNKLHMRCGIQTTGRRRRRRTNKPLTCNALFGLGVPELVVITGVAALVFGPKNLPEVGRNIGKTIKSFQQAAKEFETELKREPDSTVETAAEKQTTVRKQQEKQDTEVSSSTKDDV